MATDTTICSPTTGSAEKKPKSGCGVPVKMVIPFSLQCDNCGRRTEKGDKFWGFKEEAAFDSSLEIEVYRFQFKCPSCRADFSIKSDPGRYDYVLESGATLIPKRF